jgi:hypothetical protein
LTAGAGAAGAAYEAGKTARTVLRKQWTTPRRLHALRTLAWALAGLLLLTGETTLSRARTALRAIAKETAPSIVAAANIGTGLADLDANVANAILGNVAQRAAAEVAIENDRERVSEGILKAAENGTSGETERAPIRAMSLGLGRYLELSAKARLLHETSDDAKAREAYFIATQFLHDELLAAADTLDNAKKGEMDGAYAAQRLANEGSEYGALFVGGGLVLALAWAQVFLAMRMHRMVNPALFAATLLAVVLTFFFVSSFSDTRENLRVAKLDAFDSIYALIRARTVAYDANGEESRWLLDASPARGFEREWKRKVLLLTGAPDLPHLARVELAEANPKTRDSRFPARTKGMLWDEVRNITFDGEYDAAGTMLGAFAAYYAIDGDVRTLEQRGKHADAIELCIGTRPDESNAAFARFDGALQKTLDINQVAFDAATSRAEAELRRAEIVGPALAMLVAVLAWLGIRPRLKEYEA